MYELKLITDRSKTACFTGHRNISSEKSHAVSRGIKYVIQMLYSRGYRHFITGGALGFDTLAALAVISARGYYEDITLELCLPCRDQSRMWNEVDAEMYGYIKLQSDYCSYIRDEYSEGCMLERNRAMVEKSSYCIAYMERGRSGTGMTVRYASRLGLKMCNIADMK